MATIPSADFASDEIEIGAREDSLIAVCDATLRTLNSFLTDHCQAAQRAAADIERHSEAAEYSQPGRLSAHKTNDPNKQFNGATRSFDLFQIVQQERTGALGAKLCANFSPLLWQQ
jgi:hypothetical protein